MESLARADECVKDERVKDEWVFVKDEEQRVGLEGEFMYSADQLGAQKHIAFKQVMYKANGLVVHPPAGLTHQAAGVDRGYGRAVQQAVMAVQDEWCDADPANYEQWEDGKFLG